MAHIQCNLCKLSQAPHTVLVWRWRFCLELRWVELRLAMYFRVLKIIFLIVTIEVVLEIFFILWASSFYFIKLAA